MDEENNIAAKSGYSENHFETAYSFVVKNKSVSYATGNNTVEYSYHTGVTDRMCFQYDIPLGFICCGILTNKNIKYK